MSTDKASYTPGPWTACAQSEQVYGKDGQIIVYELNTNESDARLIAAAPNMLAALKEVARVIESNPASICDTIWVTGGRPETLYDLARAAIAKAEQP